MDNIDWSGFDSEADFIAWYRGFVGEMEHAGMWERDDPADWGGLKFVDVKARDEFLSAGASA